MSQNQFKIELHKDRINGLVIDDASVIDEFIKNNAPKSTSNVFFAEEYRKANQIIQRIIGNKDNNGTISKQSDKGKCNEKKTEPPYNRLYNNIVVFTGYRGSGKTSAMTSFGKYLADFKIENEIQYNLLEMIDPSYFRKNESILLNVITLMFKKVKELEKNYTAHGNTNYQKLVEKFEHVFQSIKKIELEISLESSLEFLDELSDYSDINESLHQLIELYLQYTNEGKYLILMIDDLDMNVAYAQLMLEQIRKFLLHDNLIILIATNLDQLHLELKEAYAKYFKVTLKHLNQSVYLSAGVDVEDMATKYLLKLFPPLQRIHLNEVEHKLLSTNLVIKNFDPNKPNEKPEILINDDLQKIILHTIWSKTRLLFIPQDGMLHPLIPTNLRALQQFIHMLLDLKDLDTDKEKLNCLLSSIEKKNLEGNYFKFKDYIMNVWIPSNVTYEEMMEFDNMPKDITRINKHLIQAINVVGSKNKKRLLLKDLYNGTKEIDGKPNKDKDQDIYTFVSPNDPRFLVANKISDVYNFTSNNTMGDILLLVDKYQTYFESTNANKFIDAIKVYYSLLLFETLFFDPNSLITKANVTNIQKLIGGTMYFPHYFEIIQDDKYKETISEISKRIASIEENKDTTVKKTEVTDFIKNFFTSNNNEEEIYNKQKERFHGRSNDVEEHIYYHNYSENNSTLESEFWKFFFILYYGPSRPKRSYGKHIYDTKMQSGITTVRFDILSLLVNLLNPLQRIEKASLKALNNTFLTNANEWFSTGVEIKDKYMPNNIFPIYSVDLMLTFLRKNYEFTDFKEYNSDNIPISFNSCTKEYSFIKDDYADMTNTITTIKDYEDKCREKGFILQYYKRLIDLTKAELNRIQPKTKTDNENNSGIPTPATEDFFEMEETDKDKLSYKYEQIALSGLYYIFEKLPHEKISSSANAKLKTPKSTPLEGIKPYSNEIQS